MKIRKVFFKNSKKQILCGVIYIPDGKEKFPILISCHGLSSSKESSNATMTYPELVKNKIAVFAFDFSGHGESEGKIEDVTISQALDDLKSALDYIENKDFINKNKISLLGSSFGGLVSIFVTKDDTRIKVLALKSPAIYYKFHMHRLLTKKGLTVEDWKNKGFIDREYPNIGRIKLNYSFYQDAIRYNTLNVSKEIKVPTLIVVGDKDETVSSERVKEFFDSLECEKEFHWIKNAKHRFNDEEEKEVFSYINRWFIKWLK